VIFESDLLELYNDDKIRYYELSQE